MTSELQGKHLHFDCVSGIAGDMCMGALIDAGVPTQVIHDAIVAMGLGEDRLRATSVVKSGIASTNVWVRCEKGQKKSHGHGHEHEHAHAHVHYSEIRDRIETSELAPRVITLALRIFDFVARAEAKLHGTSVEKVAFHEVGAIDSIVDVIGCAAAIDWLAPSSISCSPVAMGKGSIGCAHGLLPVPSPAAVEILREAKAPVHDGGLAIELCTPTGAAILAATVQQWGSMPTIVPVAIGYGAGDLDLPDRPNVVRAMLGERITSAIAAADGAAADGATAVVELEANIDDMSPELCEHAAAQLFESGAVDVWWTPILMKKGRPALALRVLCPVDSQDTVMATLFLETTSIGVRFRPVQRMVLARTCVMVSTDYGAIEVKVARHSGVVVNVAPEYEQCRARALASGVPLKLVFGAAMSAALALEPAS